MHQLLAKQQLDISVDEAWSFLQDPHNLSTITPDHMGFNITSETGHECYPGQIITYRVTPFPLFTTTWVTEITQIVEKQYFIDEQRLGPYAIWHHEHHLEEVDGGVLMTDIISYRLPFEPITKFMDKFLIRRQLRGIFEYRGKVLRDKYGSDASFDVLEFRDL